MPIAKKPTPMKGCGKPSTKVSGNAVRIGRARAARRAKPKK